VLDPAELVRTAAEFGVTEDQVRRDHLISHILHALATIDLPIVFFGGTALARTWLSDPAHGGRLSEDIDLYTAKRTEVAQTLSADLPRLLRREFPGATWDPSPVEVRAVDPASLTVPDGVRVRVQVLDTGQHRELANWPTEIKSLHMRYSDIGNGALRVPTLISFAAMKTVAWMDRAAARDLYDLAALGRIGALTPEVADLVHQVTGWTVAPYVFRTLPKFDWNAQLSNQTRRLPSAEGCLDEVRAAYAAVLDWTVAD
jgi:predicted nucleotidyltransferase component of viral defense system